jgi:hypothetical protein
MRGLRDGLEADRDIAAVPTDGGSPASRATLSLAPTETKTRAHKQ